MYACMCVCIYYTYRERGIESERQNDTSNQNTGPEDASFEPVISDRASEHPSSLEPPASEDHSNIYIYIYIYIYSKIYYNSNSDIYIYIYLFIYREREKASSSACGVASVTPSSGSSNACLSLAMTEASRTRRMAPLTAHRRERWRLQAEVSRLRLDQQRVMEVIQVMRNARPATLG